MSNARKKEHKDKKRKSGEKSADASYQSSARQVSESEITIEMKSGGIANRITNVFKNHNKPLKNNIEQDENHLKKFTGLDQGSKKNTPSILSQYLFKENVKMDGSQLDSKITKNRQVFLNGNKGVGKSASE